MADFGYFSDTDDSAVEELISQANDLSALEQIAAINCSAFTTDSSSLPVDIESRFRRLKSLPNPRPDPVSSSSSMVNNNNNKKKHLSQSQNDSRKNRDPDLKSDDESGDLSDSRESDNNFSSAKKTEKKLLGIKSSSSSSSFSSIDLATPPRSSDSEARSKKSKHKSSLRSLFNKLLSPSKIIGLIWRSPKKASKKKTKTKKKSVKSFSCEGEVDFDEFLSDLKAYSLEDQKKMLKKAMEEQQKMRKEAASIIKLTNKASAKFDFYD